MRKLFYISLLGVAGCMTPLTPQPPQPPGGSDLAGYFWQTNADTSFQYQTTDASGRLVALHKIAISTLSGTNIFDQNQTNGATTTFTVTQSNGSYSLSGFTPSDVLGFDPSLLVVSDTSVPPPQTVAVHSIATFSSHSKPTETFALSDTALYTIDNALNLHEVGNFPSGFTLAEDLGTQVLYAYTPGGNTILYSTDPASNSWTPFKQSVPITAFSSSPYFSDFCWFASGNTIYRIASGSNTTNPVATMGSNVVTMAPSLDGVVAITTDGGVYDVNRSGGAPRLLATASGVPTGIITVGFGTFIATSKGLYSFSSSNALTSLTSLPILNLYTTGNSFFASTTDSVLHYYSTGSLYGSYPNPSPTPVTQYARSTAGSVGVAFALAGSAAFSLNPIGSNVWSPINYNIAVSWQPHPGVLTLLKDTATEWTAGFLALQSNGNGQPSFFTYLASAAGPYPSLTIDSTSYLNVLTVHYTPMSNGMIDHNDAPEFLIYYKKGLGPIRIERTENGNTSVTKFVK